MKTTFEHWYEANKDSEILAERYAEYRYETKGEFGTCLSFKQWMRTQYQYHLKNGEI